MQKPSSRWQQAIDKFLFCIRVTAGLKTGLRLMLNSKRFSRYQQFGRYQKKKIRAYESKTEKALPYTVRYLSRDFMLFLRTYTGDIQMFYEIFLEQVYKLPSGFLAPVAPHSPLVIVDAGANIGMAAKYFSLVYPTAKLFCIEPDHQNFILLQKNLAEEQTAGRAFFLEAALYEKDGNINLEPGGWSFDGRINESVFSREEGQGSDVGSCSDAPRQIPGYTVKRFFDRFGLQKVDLLKMDIEGAEEGLFKGDMEWVENVTAILIEVHTPYGIQLIQDKLTRMGFFWYSWYHADLSAAFLFLASKKELPGNG